MSECQDSIQTVAPLEPARPEKALPLQAGSPAPTFTLPDADMDMFDLQEALRKHHVVLYFYPKDGTPACTRQAIEFTDHDHDFERHGAVIVGVSPDDCITHADFRDEHGLSVRLLSDPDFDVCRLYGTLRPLAADGIKRLGVLRSTFIIGRDGIIHHALHDVNPRGHAMQVLELIKELARSKNGNHQKHGRHP